MSFGSFRKIDVDQYDEDALVETELYDLDPRDPQSVLADAKQRQSAVRSALAKYAQTLHSLQRSRSPQRGDISSALVTVLDGAPYGPNVEDAKARGHSRTASSRSDSRAPRRH